MDGWMGRYMDKWKVTQNDEIIQVVEPALNEQKQANTKKKDTNSFNLIFLEVFSHNVILCYLYLG